MQEVDSLVAKGKNKYNQAMHEVDQLVTNGKNKIVDQKNENVWEITKHLATRWGRVFFKYQQSYGHKLWNCRNGF